MGKSSVDSQIREGEEEEEDTQTKKKEENIRDEEQESKAPKLVEHFASARKHLLSIDIEKYFELNPPHPPGSPPRNKGEGVTVLHPDSIKKIENEVTLEETMTVKQALSVLRRYGISSAPVVNSSSALFIGFQDVRDFMVLFFEKALVSHLTRREVLQRMIELLNETVRECRKIPIPTTMRDSYIVVRERRRFLKSFEVDFCSASMYAPTAREICGIKPATHGKRFQRVHRVAVYSLHYDTLTKDEAMTIDAVISQTDVIEFLLDCYLEKDEDEDPFVKITVSEAFADYIERKKEDLLALPSFTKAIDVFAGLTRQKCKLCRNC